MTLESIIERLRKETDINPSDLSGMVQFLAAEYAYSASLFEATQDGKPAAWLLLRDESKSASEADHKWSATPQGIGEGRLRRKLKVITLLLSSLRARLHVRDMEAKNIV